MSAFKKPVSSFRTRIFLSLFVTSLAILFLASTLLVVLVSITIDRNDRTEAEGILSSAETSCHNLLDPLDATLGNLSSSDLVISGLIGSGASTYKVYSALYDKTTAFRPGIIFRLYDQEGTLKYSTASGSDSHLQTDWGILRAAGEAKGSVCIPPVSYTGKVLPALQLARSIRDRNGTLAGYIVADIPQEYVNSIFGGLSGTRESLLITDSLLTPVYCSIPDRADDLSTTIRTRLLSGDPLETDSSSFSARQESTFGLCFFVEQHLTLAKSIRQTLLSVTVLLIFVCFVISLLVSLGLSRRLFSPIDKLQDAIAKVEQGDLDTRVRLEQRDELGALADSFDRMVHRLKGLMEQSVLRRKELDNARIRMMQAQLNPHFLCNTLDTMKWMAKINGLDDAAKMSADLADILRTSISTKEFVSLEEETRVLERYVDIQRIRFPGRFSFIIQIPEELGPCLIPKLMLQPLVENAILHGLDNRDEGTVTVTASREGDILSICVEDDGAGIPEDVLASLLAGRTTEKTSGRGHLGIYNVNTILALHYGDAYGLHFENLPMGGCRVTAVLPVSYTEDV